MIDSQNRDLLKAWPFQEALKIVKILGGFSNFTTSQKGYVLFEKLLTGLAPL